ncbi:MAG: DUF4976 domain-containing protein [Firmicutes bacterium]|nr:DUF4976 domain-containing protein [Bacillota bacterium]
MSFDEVNFVNMRGSIKMVRKGPWKLVYDLFRGCELYNLSEDPREINNLIDDPRYDSITVELKEELLRWLIRTEDELPLQRWSIRRPPHNWYWE